MQVHTLSVELLQRFEEEAETLIHQSWVERADEHDAAFRRQAEFTAHGKLIGGGLQHGEVKRDGERPQLEATQGETLLRLPSGPAARGEDGDVEFLPELGAASRLDGRDVLRIGGR